MRPARIAALIVGCLLAPLAFALFLGGGALGLGYLTQRDADGYVTTDTRPLGTGTAAVTAENVTLISDGDAPRWLLRVLDSDLRVTVTGPESAAVFVGLASTADVAAYLDGVAHDRVVELGPDATPVYERVAGDATAAPPLEQSFWVAQASGPGEQQLEWQPRAGSWALVVMNPDGRTPVSADASVAVASGAIAPLLTSMVVAGILLTISAVWLVLWGATGAGSLPPADASASASATGQATAPATAGRYPLTLNARLDPDLSRWLWLVKWFLAIPHFVLLAFLWMAFLLLTAVAGVAILFTGRYPRGIFTFNVGVLRWSWRVAHYATTGGIGTDRYPPFTLEPMPNDPATLDVVYPERLSRSLVLVKWWLLAIPHYLIVALLVGSVRWTRLGDNPLNVDATGGAGILGLLVLVAGVVLLVTARYPHALFDLIVGLNRWVYRVIAYAALMTDEYPPFRLDQGGTEPPPSLSPSPTQGASLVERAR
ncbi:DUF4389 domain-containing protein [uncultured Phycicoccus sp.]|uniref:DUF4389 domain-containing protein n=1 Tax=uncultured Phycicoccus sp. TaxID=661422 RepID=UPI00261A630B|nr:DUF4389 domain-containing protein [uncultured Phycicoccus sp.]